jgi:ketosteroid isomerase-like protein
VSQENVEILRRLYRRWEQGDFSTPEAFDPQVEFARTGGPENTFTSGCWRGLDAMWGALVEWLQAFEDVRYSADEFIAVDDRRVLVFSRQTARGKASGISSERQQADVFALDDGKIVRWQIYWDRTDARRDLGAGGLGVSANLDLVRSIYADWERGDFSSVD